MQNQKDQIETSETQACSLKVIFEFTGKQKPELATISIPEGLPEPREQSFSLGTKAGREKCLRYIMAHLNLILSEVCQWNEGELDNFKERYQW